MNSVTSRTVPVPDTAMVSTGEASGFIFVTTGGSMPGGSAARMLETFSRTSCVATSTFLSRADERHYYLAHALDRA